MALKTVRRRFGISAPRVAVYTQLPWYWQIALVSIILATVALLAWGTFLLGRSFAFRPMSSTAVTRETAEQVLARVQRENEELRSQVVSLEQRLRIDRAAHANVQEQLKELAEQSARMKEELAFFQTLGGAGGGVGIQRFKVTAESVQGEYRFRLLVVQSRQRAEHFRGRVEFIAHGVDNGKEAKIQIPKAGEKTQSYVLGFKFFQRLEGVLRVSPEFRVKQMEVRVIQSGTETPLATQMAPVS